MIPRGSIGGFGLLLLLGNGHAQAGTVAACTQNITLATVTVALSALTAITLHAAIISSLLPLAVRRAGRHKYECCGQTAKHER